MVIGRASRGSDVHTDGVGSSVKVPLEGLASELEAVDLRDVHHLEVVLHDRIQRVMPLVVDLLLGEHHDGIVLVHPAVIDHPLDQIHLVGKVDRIPPGTVVEHVVPRLVEEPEELLGDQQCLHGMVLGIQREDHAEVRLMHLPCEEVA